MIFLGESYTVAAGATVEVPKEVAEHWRNYIHSFLKIVEAETAHTVNPEPTSEVIVPIVKKAKK